MENTGYETKKIMYQGKDGLSNWKLRSQIENLTKYNTIKQTNSNKK